MTRYVTNSELETWKTCQRKWAFTHRDKRGSRYRSDDPGDSPANVGNAIHDALQAYYGGELTPADVLAELAMARDAYDPEESPEARQAWQRYDMAHSVVEGYFHWLEDTGADAHLRRWEPELEVTLPLPELGVTLLGKLDAMVYDQALDAPVILDHKSTGATLETFRNALDMRAQWRHYALITGVRRIRVNVLRRSKRTTVEPAPLYGRPDDIVLDPGELVSYRAHLGVWLAAMRDAPKVPPPSPGGHCTYCPIRRACRLLDEDPHGKGLDAVTATTAPVDTLARYSEEIRNDAD